MSGDSKTTVVEYVDDIRAQFDKINKLVADVEEWHRQVSDEGDSSVEERHIQAARGVLAAGLQMRQTLYKVERAAYDITEEHDKQVNRRFSSFFEA